MIKSSRTIIKKSALYTAAFVLAVSTLTAAMSHFLGRQVDAVAALPNYTYSQVSLDQANWTPDRQSPSGSWSVDPSSGSVLMSIDQNNASTSNYYKTEGLKTTVPVGTTSLSGSFLIGSDWNAKTSLRVGLWGVTNNPAGWPIIEYVANSVEDGYTGWRIWDTFNGGWTKVDASTSIGMSNSVEIVLDKASDTFNFYVNGAAVGSFAAGGRTHFTNMILNSYNSGTGNPADNYVVDWRNLKAGQAIVATNTTKGISYDNAQEALDAAVSGDTVRLDADVTLPSASLQLLTPGVMLDGNNKTVRPGFMGVNNTKNSAAVYVGANNVTISNLTVVGPSNRASSMHNIQVYNATGVALNNVTVKNATKSGLLVNGSKVSVTNLATENNAWAAVNVDNAGAHLTVLGTVTHIEPVTAYAHIFVDNRAELDAGDVKVTYSGQYVRFWEANGYAYFVDTEKPTVATTINNAYNPTEITVTAHDDQRLNRIDVSLRKDNGAVVTKWWGENIAYIHKNDRTLDLSQSIASLNLPDGSYTVRATVSDILGKTVNAVNQSFIVDHKKPSVSVDMSDRLIGLNDATPTLRIDANDANGVNRVQYKIVRAEDESKTVAGWVTIANGVDTEVSVINSIGDGNYILVARAYDNAENKQSGLEVAFTIDRTAPEAAIPDYTSSNNTITPNVTSDDSTATYSWALTSGDIAGLAPFDSQILLPTFTVLTDGTYEFELTTTDAAGNSSVTPFRFTYATPVVLTPVVLVPTTQTIAGVLTQSNVGGFSNVVADSAPVPAVLGVQTENPEDTSEVKGVETEAFAQAANVDREASGIGGLAWYWWLIIAAAALGLAWWIAAAARRRNSEA